MTTRSLKPFAALRPWLLAAALILAALAATGKDWAACSAAQQSPAQPQLPPPNWTRSHDYDVQHYRIQVSFDWPQRRVSGETTITLRPFADNFKEAELDAGAMTIKSVTLAGGQPLRYQYDGQEKLRVLLDKPYPAGQDVSFTISYSAQPKKGLTFITPNEDDPQRPYQIWSQGQAESNHYWFPCYDYPNDRATSETIITVEDKYQVISNGALIAVRRDPVKRTATYHWKMDQPFPSYLVSLIVGDFAEIKQAYAGIPILSYVPKDRVADARASLGKIDDMMRFFTEKLGVKYPYSKYAQTTVRDFPGGMENISATTLGDAIIYDQRARLDQSADNLLAHELVHQWFGNLLTCRDWSEIWLNEGFATYFAHLYTEHDQGRDEMLYAMLSDQRAYFNAWAQGNRQPIVNNRYTDPDSVFGVYAYARAGAVLHMLRFVLGEEAWWKAIQHYLKINTQKSVETAQLKIAIEEVTGQNLGWFFDQWVLKMGHPEFEVSYAYDEAAQTVKLKVKQTQKPPERSPYPVAAIFRLPVEIGLTTARGERIERVWVDQAEQEFALKVDAKPLIVNFDRGNRLIKQLKFDKPVAELAYQARHDADMTGRIRAVNELRLKQGEAAAAQALGEVLAKDAFWGVRVEAARALAAFQGETVKLALLTGAKDAKSAVRREAIKALGQLKDKELADFFIGVIGSDQSYYVIGDAARALGATGSPKAYDVLVKTLDAPSDKDVIRAAAMDGLNALNDPRALELALKYAAAPHTENVRAAAIQVAAKFGAKTEALRDRLLQLFTAPLKGEGMIQLKFTAIGALGQLGDPRAIPALEAVTIDEATLGPAAPFFRQFIQGTLARLRAAANKPDQ
jgi:aminopeptidase N